MDTIMLMQVYAHGAQTLADRNHSLEKAFGLAQAQQRHRDNVRDELAWATAAKSAYGAAVQGYQAYV
jgi:hypothetical protein